MKLYFAPGPCSLSPHIILRELGIPFELVKVDNKSKTTAQGDDYRAINPKGYVPALVAHNGEVLTEGVAIVQYLADIKPELALAPVNGTWERSRLQETLNYIASEVHGTMGPMFNPALPDAAKDVFKDKLINRIGYLADILGKQDFLLGSTFTVVDAYLFTVLAWPKYFGIEISQWPAIASYVARIAARPAVKAALDAEAAA
jgi:glutathione S-transferase